MPTLDLQSPREVQDIIRWSTDVPADVEVEVVRSSFEDAYEIRLTRRGRGTGQDPLYAVTRLTGQAILNARQDAHALLDLIQMEVRAAVRELNAATEAARAIEPPDSWTRQSGEMTWSALAGWIPENGQNDASYATAPGYNALVNFETDPPKVKATLAVVRRSQWQRLLDPSPWDEIAA